MSKDLFSTQSGDYAKYRPSYPTGLISEVLDITPGRDMAWDCATGNGQAAYLLAQHFSQVIATDISGKQLSLAKQHDNIEYLKCSAEHTPLPVNSIDLVTVAQAYHWFNFHDFETEVRRVSRPNAVIAIWSYNLPKTQHSFVNAILTKFYTEITGPYWDPERKFIDEGYKTVPFNYKVLLEKELSMTCDWSDADMLGYLNSWSSVQHFIAENKFNPLTLIIDDLKKHWNEGEIMQVSFPLFLKCGAVSNL